MRPVDLLIVGGGPGGATLAGLAAAAGARVLVVERCRFPRDKVCGEFVSVQGCRVLERLGALGPLLDRGAAWIDSWRITDRRGRAIAGGLPDLPGLGRRALGVSRALLDSTLLKLARHRGAQVLERWEAVAPLLDEGRVAGVCIREVGGAGAIREARAAQVVAADGRRSLLVRSLHPAIGDPASSHPGSWFGLKVHLAGSPSRLGRRVELHVFDRGYAGLAAVEDRRINLCLMVTVGTLRACGGSPNRLFGERVLLNPALREVVGGSPTRGSWKSVGPLQFGVRQPAAAGVLFVGDAAGTIDPYSGEGISNALRGAEIALPYALEAAARGQLTGELARAYRDAWTQAFAPVTRRVRFLGSLLERPWLAGRVLGMLSRFGAPLLPRLAASTRSSA